MGTKLRDGVIALLERPVLFKFFYMLLAVSSCVPFIHQYTGPFFKLLLPYGFALLTWDLIRRRGPGVRRYRRMMLAFAGCALLATLLSFRRALVANLKLYAYLVIGLFVVAQVRGGDREAARRELYLLNNLSIEVISLVSLASFLFFLFQYNGSYALPQAGGGKAVYSFGVAYGNRLTGITGNPNTMGLLSLLALADIFLNTVLFRPGRWVRFLYALAAGIHFLCFIMASSRGAELGFAAFFIVFFYLLLTGRGARARGKAREALRHTGCFALAAAAAFTIWAAFPAARQALGYLPPAIQWLGGGGARPGEPSSSISEFLQQNHVDLERADLEDEEMGNGRVALWEAGARLIAKHPLFGVGKEGLAAYARQALPGAFLPGIEGGGMHNIFIETAVCYGLTTLAALLWWMSAVLLDAARAVYGPRRRERDPVLWGLLATAAMLVCNNLVEANILFSAGFVSFYFLFHLGYLMAFLEDSAAALPAKGGGAA